MTRPSRLHRAIGGRTGHARVAFAVALMLMVPSAAWVGAPLARVIDLVGNFASHVLPIVLLTAVAWTVLRYRRAAVTGWMSVALLVWPLAIRRAPPAPPGAAPIRVLAYNALAGRRPAEAGARMILESGADVAGVCEVPDRLYGAMFADGAMRRAFPHTVFRVWNSGPPTTTQVLLSRWPITRPDGRPLDESFATVIEAVVHAPSGPVGIVVVHLFSARSDRTWSYSLDEAERAAAAARRLQAAGLPVIVLGDFNSTPSGLACRTLASLAGLRRCKPWLRADGTFPARLPWPLRLAIDDAMVSRSVSVASWRTLEPAGSDHRPVLVDLALPGR